MEELLPGVEHRFCVRHLYNNFRKRFPGKRLKELMWKVAKASYPQAWQREMKEIKAIGDDSCLSIRYFSIFFLKYISAFHSHADVMYPQILS
jgi:hypothetical protein